MVKVKSLKFNEKIYGFIEKKMENDWDESHLFKFDNNELSSALPKKRNNVENSRKSYQSKWLAKNKDAQPKHSHLMYSFTPETIVTTIEKNSSKKSKKFFSSLTKKLKSSQKNFKRSNSIIVKKSSKITSKNTEEPIKLVTKQKSLKEKYIAHGLSITAIPIQVIESLYTLSFSKHSYYNQRSLRTSTMIENLIFRFRNTYDELKEIETPKLKRRISFKKRIASKTVKRGEQPSQGSLIDLREERKAKYFEIFGDTKPYGNRHRKTKIPKKPLLDFSDCKTLPIIPPNSAGSNINNLIKKADGKVKKLKPIKNLDEELSIIFEKQFNNGEDSDYDDNIDDEKDIEENQENINLRKENKLIYTYNIYNYTKTEEMEDEDHADDDDDDDELIGNIKRNKEIQKELQKSLIADTNQNGFLKRRDSLRHLEDLKRASMNHALNNNDHDKYLLQNHNKNESHIFLENSFLLKKDESPSIMSKEVSSFLLNTSTNKTLSENSFERLNNDTNNILSLLKDTSFTTTTSASNDLSSCSSSSSSSSSDEEKNDVISFKASRRSATTATTTKDSDDNNNMANHSLSFISMNNNNNNSFTQSVNINGNKNNKAKNGFDSLISNKKRENEINQNQSNKKVNEINLDGKESYMNFYEASVDHGSHDKRNKNNLTLDTSFVNQQQSNSLTDENKASNPLSRIDSGIDLNLMDDLSIVLDDICQKNQCQNYTKNNNVNTFNNYDKEDEKLPLKDLINYIHINKGL